MTTRTAPPPTPEDIGQVTATTPKHPRPDRPGFTAELVDIDPDGQRTYAIADQRGYTVARDTVRIGARWVERDSGGRDVVGTVEVWRRDGWHELTTYDRREDALPRAFRLLYGEEDHG